MDRRQTKGQRKRKRRVGIRVPVSAKASPLSHRTEVRERNTRETGQSECVMEPGREGGRRWAEFKASKPRAQADDNSSD